MPGRHPHHGSSCVASCDSGCGGCQTQSKGRRNAPICYDFVKGMCQRGPECRYSHDLASIIHTTRPPKDHLEPLSEVCYDFVK